MDNYVEQIVDKLPSVKQKLALFGAIFVTAIGVTMIFFYSFSIGVAVIAVGAFLIYLAKMYQAMEYEYLFVNGDCDIAAIINKSNRKNTYSFKAGDVTRVLPYNSLKFQNELEVNAELSVKDLSSGKRDNRGKCYAFLVNVKGGTLAVVLELNEKTIEHVESFYKNKIEM